MPAGPSETGAARWKWVMLALCTASLFATVVAAADVLGFDGRPWFGWWDANTTIAGPYTVAVAQPRPDGAAARAGLKEGDRVDLREQSLAARIAILYQLMAAQPTDLTIQSAAGSRTVRITGSSMWEDATAWKLPPMASWIIANLWFALCAIAITLRRWRSRDARMLALVLLFTTGAVFEPTFVVVPNGSGAVALLVLARSCATAAFLLLIALASRFGVRQAWRAGLAATAYAAIVVGFLADLALAAGIVTLRFDPIPLLFRISSLRDGLDIFVCLLVAATAAAAVAATPPAERPRAGWLLLPLPISFLATVTFTTLATFVQSWFANVAVIGVAEAIRLLGALIVTYALLNRRVLDFEFVLSRTLVVASVSLIVVVSFVLLDWMLGTILAGVSHATGLVANGALALVLGLSLNVIQKRVNALLDAVIFRKRHEDERALLDFSREAAYASEPEALLDRAIEKLKRHTNARGAAVLLRSSTSYAAARSYGDDISREVDENDAAVLALKTWHKPVDPHHYTSSLVGALALPLLERGQLRGLVLVGERTGGEAYAPDEVLALTNFALGVGAALGVLAHRAPDALAALEASIDALRVAVLNVRDMLAAERH